MDKAGIVTVVSQYKDKQVSMIGLKLIERTAEILKQGKKL